MDTRPIQTDARVRAVVNALRSSAPSVQVKELLTHAANGKTWSEITELMDMTMPDINRACALLVANANLGRSPDRLDVLVAGFREWSDIPVPLTSTTVPESKPGPAPLNTQILGRIVHSMRFLTEREQLITQCASDGLAKESIAEKLGLERHVVSAYLTNILVEKLGLRHIDVLDRRRYMAKAWEMFRASAPQRVMVQATPKPEPAPQAPELTPKPDVADRDRRYPVRVRRAKSERPFTAPPDGEILAPIVERFAHLTKRQKEVLPHVLNGLSGEKLMVAAGYANAGTASATASNLLSSLRVPVRMKIGNGGYDRYSYEERAQIARQAYEKYKAQAK